MGYLEGLGATISIGLYLIIGGFALFYYIFKINILSKITSFFANSNLGNLVVFLAMSYALGILVENTADYGYGSKTEKSRFWNIVRLGTKSESELKEVVIIKENNLDLTPLGKKIVLAGMFSKYAGEEFKNFEHRIRLGYQPAINDRIRNAIKEVYYTARNRVLLKDSYFTELTDIQHRIDLTRSFTHATGCLFIFLTLLSIISWIKLEKSYWFIRKQDVIPGKKANDSPRESLWKMRKSIFVKLIIMLSIFLFFYYVSLRWGFEHEEKQYNKRVFGYFLNLENLDSTSETEGSTLAFNYRMFEFYGSSLSEASGIASFGDNLLIVDDKKNNLYIANSDFSGTPDIFCLNLSGLVAERAKFEAVEYHHGSEYFYVIGAHYPVVNAYQKLYRFKLVQVNNGWHLKDDRFEPIDISGHIITKLSNTTSIEGLSVTGRPGNTILYLGIRSIVAGDFKLLKYQEEDGIFLFKNSIDLDLYPEYTNLTNYNLHISGLTALSDNRLMVLVASEDLKNGFHGNRIFTVEFDENGDTFAQISESIEFEPAQKAEGIAVIKDKDNFSRLFIVFDNDFSKTYQPGRLMIIDSIDGFFR